MWPWSPLGAGNRQGGSIRLTPLSQFRPRLGSQAGRGGEWGCLGSRAWRKGEQVHWFQVKGLVDVGKARLRSSAGAQGRARRALKGRALSGTWGMGAERAGGLPQDPTPGIQSLSGGAHGL